MLTLRASGLVMSLIAVASVGGTVATPANAKDGVAIADALAKSAVRVEYTLKYDRGEEPSAAGWRYRCASCGQYHNTGGAQVINEERPAEQGGFLIAPTRVITADPMVHARFIERIDVVFGDQRIEATPKAYPVDQRAVILELSEPLSGAMSVAFDSGAAGPYHTVTFDPGAGSWTLSVAALPTTVITRDTGDRVLAAPTACLIVGADAVGVGMTFTEELPADGSWKASPETWRVMSALDLENAERAIGERCATGVVHATLLFRSPSQDAAPERRWSPSGSQSDTEWTGAGIVVDPHTVIVLADLKPATTARLERVRLRPEGGETVDASFVGSLKDHGALVVRTEQPLAAPVSLSPVQVLDLRHTLLVGAEVRIQGQTRTTYYNRARIASYIRGWKQNVYPELSTGEGATFVYALDGTLAVFPMSRRTKVAVEETWGYDDSAVMTPVAHLRPILADLESHFDANNVPLSEEEEARIAWLGVELQALDPELARANEVTAETRDGEFGAVVTHVYPGSPAERAALEVGDILLRIHAEDQPKPVDVSMAEDFYGFMDGFPWDQLDEVPDMYFDQIPQPWPPAANALNRSITALGFGSDYELEFIRNGEKRSVSMSVEHSPAYYLTAPKYEHEPLGLTVKNLTFEVQRYFQRTSDEGGVVISAIESGSRASIGGLKPYEVITHINDEPVMNVGDFERLMPAEGDVRFSVKRMTRGRIVKIDLN
jgi:hypothetical protein